MKSPIVLKLAERLAHERYSLNAPATDAALASLGEVHPHHRAVLATTDGWASLEGYEVLSTGGVKKWSSILAEEREDGAPWKTTWVPFSVDSRGNLRCVDAVSGKLVTVDRQDGHDVREWPETLNDYLEDLDRRLDDQRLALDEDGLLQEVFAEVLPNVATDDVAAIEAAMDEGDFEALRRLLAPTGPNATVQWKTTLLVFAITRGAQLTLEWLLAQGADVDCGKKQQLRTPLFAACWGERPEVELAKLFLSRGADPNAWSPDGTPLHAAARWGHVELVKLLLAHGADPSVTDEDGDLAGQLAESEDVRSLLGA